MELAHQTGFCEFDQGRLTGIDISLWNGRHERKAAVPLPRPNSRSKPRLRRAPGPDHRCQREGQAVRRAAEEQIRAGAHPVAVVLRGAG
jgi:hypothetical protein